MHTLANVRNKTVPLIQLIIVLVILISAIKPLIAQVLPVPNGSFESPATPFVDTRIDSWEKSPQPSTFDTNIFGAWDTLAGVFLNSPATNSSHIDNASGLQLAYLFAYPQIAIFQDYASTDWSNSVPTHAFAAQFEPGNSYRLTVGVTSSSQEPLNPGSTLRMSLYYRDATGAMVTVKAADVTFSTNIFTNLADLVDFQVDVPPVQASDPWAGQYIGIQFQSTVDPTLIGGVWDLDNVRLTAAIAPALSNPSLANGHFRFSIQGEPSGIFEILSATNLVQPPASWLSLGILTNTTGSISFTDTNTVAGQRFYRVEQR
jgi:hypothetical protein